MTPSSLIIHSNKEVKYKNKYKINKTPTNGSPSAKPFTTSSHPKDFNKKDFHSFLKL